MKKRVLSLFLAITLCLSLTPTGALAADVQLPEQTVSVTQNAQTGADENAPPANPEENPTEDAPAAAEKNTADEETGKEAAAATGRDEPKADGSPSDDDAAKVQNQLVMAAAAGPGEPTMMGQNDLLAPADEGQTPSNAQNSEGGGIYVPPGSTTEGGGGTYIPGEDTRTEIWCTSKPDSIGRSYDGTTDGGTIPIDLTFTDGTNEIKLKERTGFTAKKTFDSADAGWHTVTVEITLIGEAAAKYKLKAGEETFAIGGYIDKAHPDLTVSLSKTACTVGEKILPLLSVSGAPEGAAVTYYYTQYKTGYLEFEGSNAVPEIDANTAISEPGTYYVYAKTGGTKNYEEERSTTAELTVNEAVVEAASVTKADGTERTYGSFTDALAAAVESNGSTLQLHYDVDLGDANDGLSVDSGKFTLDLNSKTLSGKVDYQLLTVSGTADITIKNGKLVNTFSNDSPAMNRGLANAIQITGGTAVLENVEVTSGCGENGEHTDAVCLSDGNLTVANGTFTGAILVMPKTADQHPVLKITSATLHNGIGYFIWNTSNPDYDGVKALFADGSLLFDKDGNYIDITNADYWQTDSSEEESFTATIFAYGEECSVKPHTHTIVNGKCSVCGEVEGDGCIAHAVWSPYADYPQWRTTHIKTMDELREKITSPGTKWLDFDNNATVTFLCDVTVDKTFLIDNYYTNIIIDLNGHTLSGALDGPVITANFVSGTGTIDFKNGKIVNTGNGEAIRLAKGKVTLENVDVTGDLSLTYDFVNSLSYIPTFLGGGSFTKICTVNDAGGWQKFLEDMLPKGYYFADITSGKRVSQTVLNADSPLENVTVKPCNHKDADGKSTFTYKPERQTYYYCSICGNICPHEHRTELADGSLHCEDCNLTLTAARRDSKNTITYYIDMSDAFGNAYQPIIWPLCDQTCTQAAMTYYGSNTIDLNGFTVTANNSSGVLFAPYVSAYKMTLQNSAENQGHYVCEYLQVYNDGTLAIPAENNNLTISAVLIKSDGNANLAGGSFGKISVEGEKTLAGLLVSGYYFADTASGEPAAMYDADGTALTELTNVTVQPCSHDTAVCGSDGVWKCLCGQNVFVASVTKDGTPTYYTDLQNAFSAADGNTVKLMANVRDVTVSTDKPFTFDLNGYNVYSLTVNNKSTIKDSATVKGKITEWLKVPSGMTVGELLEDGYAFKKSNGTWCSGVEQAGQAVGNVSIWPVPIRSVTAANPSVTVAYGQTSGRTLTATVVPFAEGGPYTCQWYKIGGTSLPLDGATDSTYQLPVDLAAGTYTYRLTATEDGYEKSCDFTVTVTPVSIEGAAVNVQSLTYNGVAQNPTATVTLGETVLTGNKDYTVMTTAQTNVGSYTLTVTGKGNYTGKIENVNWKIEPMQLYRFCDIEPVTKVYDGTAVAPIAKSALAFHDANARGASVTLPEDAYDITNARFTMRQGDGTYVESPEAGNGKSLSFTVMLKSGNYVFKGGTADVMDCDYTTDKVDMFTIMQDTISLSGIQFTQYVFNDLAKTYEINLKQFLDTILPADGEYGNIVYGQPSVSMDSAYYTVGGANIRNGKLSLSINKTASSKQGDEIGRVTVKVETTNYQPFTLTIHVIAKNKLTPVPDGTISASEITYGDTLSKSEISGKMKDPSTGDEVKGTFTWTDGAVKPDANDRYEAGWKFTPTNQEKYAEVTGTVTIKVNKAATTGEPKYTAIITSGKTLKDAALTTEGSTLKPNVGNLEWVDDEGSVLPNDTTVDANKTYKWRFTPTDVNYTVLTGSIELYHRSSGGGGSYTPSYTVSVDKTENGTITVSPKSASKGDTVTFSVKPDKGYELDTLKVLDQNGDKVKLTEKDGKYTFKMPDSKVEIQATFVKETEISPFGDVSTDAYYYEAVKWAQKKGITGGIGNDLFGPNQPCIRAQIATFLWRAAGSPEPKNMSSFSDVPADSYYAKAVAWAVENGITTGTGDGKFSPNAPCTRAQSVTFLYRASGSPAVSDSAVFGDVAANAFYADAVAWAVANGVTNGTTSSTFSPDNGCTRAQIVTFLYRAFNK